MAIKPIDHYEDDEESYESDGLTVGNMLKTVFLMVIIFFGAFYWWYSYTYGDEISKRMARAGVKPTPSISPTPVFNPEKELSTEAETVLGQIKDQSTTLLDTSMKQAVDIGGNVMGEATKQVQTTATTSAEVVTDTVKNTLYENTIGKVILQLFNSLPDEAKKNVAEDICKETGDCKVE